MRELQTGANLGSWLDSKKNGLVVDPSVLRPTLEDAMGIARKAKQDAIFDVGTGQNILTTPERVLGRGNVFGGTPQEKMNFIEYLMSRATGPKKAMANTNGKQLSFSDIATGNQVPYSEVYDNPLFKGLSPEDLKKAQPILIDMLKSNSALKYLNYDIKDIEDIVSGKVKNIVGKSIKGRTKTKDGNYKVLSNLEGIVRPVRHVNPENPDTALVKLLKEGKNKEFLEAISDQVYNLLNQMPQDVVEESLKRGTSSYYPARTSLINEIASANNINPNILATPFSAASKTAGPDVETSRVLSLLPHLKIGKDNKIVVDRKTYYNVNNTSEGDKIFMNSIIKSLEDSMNNILAHGSDISGISHKTHPYNVLALNPENKVAYVSDTVDTNARTGVKANLPTGFNQSLLGQLSGRIVAEILGLSPAQAQEIPWFTNRILTNSNIKTAFPFSPSELTSLAKGEKLVNTHNPKKFIASGLLKNRGQLIRPEVAALANEKLNTIINEVNKNNPLYSDFKIVNGFPQLTDEVANILKPGEPNFDKKVAIMKNYFDAIKQ